jgi:hypothetical protein
MFYNDFGDFLNNPPSFGSNSVFQKNVFLVFWTFREQARFRIFETNAMG